MKSNKLLKAAAFILAMITLVLTAASAVGLIGCLASGTYSEGKSSLTRNLAHRIMRGHMAQVESYLFDSPNVLENLFKDSGLQAKINAPDGSLFMVAGEKTAPADAHSLTVKCVYLENYKYCDDSTDLYFVDVDGEMEPLTEEDDIMYISPEEMDRRLAEGDRIMFPNPDIPVGDGSLSSPQSTKDTQLPAESEPFPGTDVTGITDTGTPDTGVPDEGPDYYTLAKNLYIILPTGDYSPIYSGPVFEMTYTGPYTYSDDGEYGWMGNVFGEEIESNAYTVTLTMTEAYCAKHYRYDYEYVFLKFVGDNMYNFIWFTPLLLTVTILLLVFLASASGHTKNGIRPTIIEKIPFDLYLAICTLLGMTPFFFHAENIFYDAPDIYLIVTVIVIIALGYAALLISVIMSIALRIKLKELFKNTIIARVLKLLYRGAKLLCRAVAYICRNIGAMWTTVLCSAVFILWAMILTIAAATYGDGAIVFMIAGIIGFPTLFIYTGYQANKIKKGSKRIASGDVDYKIPTDRMTPNQKDQAEIINGIGSGLSAALTERVKSERLKTELITNVSHDLKTPLTSIVNYSDLLSKEQSSPQPDSEKMGEYIDILCRQSARLKKLTEDLVEASKASTGNIESRPERLDIGELLSQSVGEFADRFAAAGLTPVENKPQEPIYIIADGRHIWRIFENLLVNTCKYSLAGTRVHIELSALGTEVTVTIKNISAQPLDFRGDELTERFVRGDASRHTEGSGLGLSIARSLAELQGGSLKIEADGDCFKVYLKFRRV